MIKRKKGFTLIELLAVIVVLAIIMVIAVPLVLNTIEDAKKGAFKSSVYGMVKAAKLEYTKQVMQGNQVKEIIYTYEDGEETSSIGKELEIKRDKPKNGEIRINKEGEVALAIHDGTYCAKKNYEEEEIEITEVSEEECKIEEEQEQEQEYTYYSEDKRVNKPVLTSGMTPIKWDEELNEITTTEDDPDWYDYSEKRWANDKTEDGSYWVWIPRYAYKITSCFHSNCSGDAGNIDIKFLIETTNEAADGMVVETSGYNFGVKDTSMHYFLHPAFTFGNEEIPGFWVAKFEPSGTENDISILPNVSSLRSMTISDQFDAAFNMKNNSKYGWSEAEVDTHMMKNTEWGAVAYLSQSEYGANAEIWNNSYNGYRTGCGGSSVSAYDESTCYEYTTTNGQKASTTHNIYGVYDMSGGAYDRVAAYVDNGNSNLSTYGQSIINADSKYKDVYISLGDTQQGNYEANKNKYGDAVYETSSSGDSSSGSWNSDWSYMPYSSYPWFHRGGNYNSGTAAGAFNFSYNNGVASLYNSFRPVVVPAASPAP